MNFLSELLREKGRKVHSIHPSALVLDAVREMDQRRVGALLVIDETGLVGVVSERDYARRVILKGRRSDATRVDEIMTSELVTVELGTTIDECMQLMTERRVRHLPVLDGGELIGVISIGDLVRVIMERQKKTIAHLKDYIAS